MRDSVSLVFLASICLAAAGCGTTKWSDTPRTATEQLLISTAVDRAIDGMNFKPLAGKDIYLDTTFLEGIVDKNYVISSLRQHMLAQGCILALAGYLPWRPVRIGAAVLPAIVGVTATILGGQRGLALLVVGFGVFWLYEHRSVGGELPPDYLSLRRNLSLVVCTLLAVTMILSDSAGLT